MKLTSSAFLHNDRIPSQYTCEGDDMIPPFEILEVPQSAKSLVLIMDDPDVPEWIRPEKMWDHWLVWNIPPTTQLIKEGEEPHGVIGQNSGATQGYMGPCPPDREHRYFFKLYAIDTLLDLPDTASKLEVMNAMTGHVIEEAELIGRYTLSAKEKEGQDKLDTIKIGFISGFTGPYSKIVDNQYKGALLAVTEMNNKGGILGRKVEIIKRDDTMKAEVAEAMARDLVDNVHVDFLLGTLSAPTATAENKVAVEKNIPFVALNQVSAITQEKGLGPYTFHEGFTPFMTAQLVGRWAVEKFGKRIFLVVPDYQWGYESYDAYTQVLLRHQAIEVGLIKMPLGFTKDDFAQHIPGIKNAKPDVLIATNFGEDQVNFIKAINGANLQKDIGIVLGVSEISIRESLSQEELVGIYWGANFYWGLADAIASAQRFVDSFRGCYNGEYPTGYAGFAYSGAMELLQATELSQKYPLDYNAIAKIMEGRKYDHYKGEQWWRPCDHQSFQDIYIMRFKGPEECKDANDIAEIVDRVKWDLDIEHSCEELGHAKYVDGHIN